MASPPAAPAPLDPNMVYRPLTPSSEHHGDHEEPPLKFRIHIIAYLRFLTLLCALTGAIAWLASRGLHFKPVTVQFAFLWVVLFWNVALLLHKGTKSKKHGPSFHCEIGLLWCTCGPDDDRSAAIYADDDDGAKPPPKDTVRVLWILDVVLGLIVIIPTIVACSALGPWGRRNREVGLIFSFLTGILEVIIGLATHFKIFRPALIYLYPDEYPHRTSRIQLPRGTDRQSRGAHPISITA